MSEQSFPRVRRLGLAYSAGEDRVLLSAVMVSGQRRALWVTRRVLAGLIGRIEAGLKRSHPAAEQAPAADAVMAMEHLAARSELAGGARRNDQGVEASGEAGERSSGPTSAEEPAVAYLITRERVEIRDGSVLVGLAGHRLPAEPGVVPAPEGAGGLALTRSQAHELLRLFTEQAEQAHWELPRTPQWVHYDPGAQQGQRAQGG